MLKRTVSKTILSTKYFLFFSLMFIFVVFFYAYAKNLRSTEVYPIIVLQDVKSIHKMKKTNLGYELIEIMDIDVSKEPQYVIYASENKYIGMMYSFVGIDCVVDFTVRIDNDIYQTGFMGENITIYVDREADIEYEFTYKYGDPEVYDKRYYERYREKNEITNGKLYVYGVVLMKK